MEAPDLERWNRVQRLFDHAVDLPPAERAAYLDAACGGDAAARAELEALLKAEAEAGAFLERPPGGFARALIAELAREEADERRPIGQRIGPYRLLDLLGSGGMGAVYLAEREAPRKRVALKLIHAGMGTHDVRRRFLNEREILAALEHPAIARLLDGGVTAEGLPYFVMEHVDGEPLDAYCDRHRLPVPERLALFREVCRAVAYAHQNLVVHRDLKPQNILVAEGADGRPRVKLLDFGIAKVLQPDRVPGAVALTRTQARLMTPEYASPEQVQGAPVTTASDVYALGVLLYELLTGHRPHRSRTLQHELARAVLEEDPLRPSTAVMRTEEVAAEEGGTEAITPADVGQARSTSPARLRRRLRGDLDNIVMKALRKEKERRYASAEQLAEDVRRYLEGLPIKARRGTAAYRTRKFVRRHWAGMAAAALVVLSLVGGLGAALVAQREAAAERDRAERMAQEARREARKTERMMAFTVSVFQGAGFDTRPGRAVTARDLLSQGAERVGTELEDEPEMQAEMLEVLGQVHRGLMLYEEAVPLLERALAQQKKLYGPSHPRVTSGLHELALLRQRTGHYDAAESLFQEALKLRRRLHGATPHPDVAESLLGLGGVLQRKGRHADAERLYREALRQREALYGARDVRVAKCWLSLGLLLQFKGAYAEAAEALQKALAIHQRYPEGEVAVANASAHLASVQRDLGAYAEAEPTLRRVLGLWEEWYGKRHPRTAIGQHRLAELLYYKGAYAEADSLYRRALAIRRSALGDGHASVAMTATRWPTSSSRPAPTPRPTRSTRPRWRRRRTSCRGSTSAPRTCTWAWGGSGSREGRLAEAERHLREGLRISQERLPEGHPQTAVAQSLLGRCLALRGRAGEADVLLARGYGALEAKLGSAHPSTERTREWVEDVQGFEVDLVEAPDAHDPATISAK